MLWVLIRIASPRRGDSNEHPQHSFYEDLTKIIFELSSNIIKYAPYFFCWLPFRQVARSNISSGQAALSSCLSSTYDNFEYNQIEDS